MKEPVTFAADFDCWWSVNHPFDWWAKERNGEPLPHGDRLRVWSICRQAWAAGQIFATIKAANDRTERHGTATPENHKPL